MVGCGLFLGFVDREMQNITRFILVANNSHIHSLRLCGTITPGVSHYQEITPGY